MSVVLSVSAIIEGVFYEFGKELPYTKKTLPKVFHKYIAKPEAASTDEPADLTFQLNTTYGVDNNDNLASAAMAEEAIEEELPAPLDPVTEAAIAEGQEAYAVDLERQKAQLQSDAKRRDVAVDSAEQYLKEQWAEENDMVSPSVGTTEVGDDEDVGDDEEVVESKVKKSNVPRANSSKGKLFVKRAGGFVAASSVELTEGEKLYRHRPP
jgi:hypothetical protein